MADYMDIYSGQIFETDYIPREAVRCETYHNQEPLTEYQLNSIPAADVVSRDCYDLLLAENDDLKKQYTKLLKAARAMHTWIFLKTTDELEAYGECGLDDDMNTLIGYGGAFEIIGGNNG